MVKLEDRNPFLTYDSNGDLVEGASAEANVANLATSIAEAEFADLASSDVIILHEDTVVCWEASSPASQFIFGKNRNGPGLRN